MHKVETHNDIVKWRLTLLTKLCIVILTSYDLCKWHITQSKLKDLFKNVLHVSVVWHNRVTHNLYRKYDCYTAIDVVRFNVPSTAKTMFSEYNRLKEHISVMAASQLT